INPNLFVIGTGPVPPNPSELLELPEVLDLLNWLRLNFDEILIDTPPILLVTDAMILSRYTDANLYVIRYGYTYKSQLEQINQLFRDNKLQKLNIIFNGVEGKGSGYGYGYYNKEERNGIGEELENFLKRF
ncbi:MAG TPA: sugar transporter, partial [Flavobacterium sp.]